MLKSVRTPRRRRPAVEALEPRTLLSTYMVTNTLDSGSGSLRQAILNSNANPGSTPNVIDFSIGTGQQVIDSPTTPLPTVTAPAIINGESQPGYAGSPLIQLNGFGLDVSAGGSTVEGLDLVSTNGGPLLALADNGGNTVQGNWLGLGLTGNAAAGNAEYGVYINGSPSNIIGGTTPAQRNVISGITADTGSAGVLIFGMNSMKNVVEGNYIGTNAAGNAAVGNAMGVDVDYAAVKNTIGGTAPGAGNVIAGNTTRDILLENESNNTVIQGNLIGLNAAGNAALNPSCADGIDSEYSTSNTIGGTSAGARNIISGHVNGIYVYGYSGTQGAYNIIQGNYIGTDITGTVAIPNTDMGVVLQSEDDTLGGTTAAARNIISGNNLGLVIYTPTSTIEGNYIGLNPSGAALGNTNNGVLISGTGVVFGGTASGAGNVVSGNANGIVVTSANAVLEGNFVGTDPTGTKAVPNVSSGILLASVSGAVVGGTAAGDRNIISGNAIDGIKMTGGASNTGNTIEGNYIGTNLSGTAAVPNGYAGVSIQGPARTIVGGAGGANQIAYNGTNGVEVTGTSATGNTISQNSIYSNAGIGIDLNADGPTPNHSGGAVSGPNSLLNHPVLNSVTFSGSAVTISGTFNSAASSNFTLEFFSSPVGSGSLQGRTYLGNTAVTTDVNGNATFTVTLPTTATSAPVTATATDSAGDTSEFSLPATAAAPGVAARMIFYNDSVFDGNSTAVGPADDAAIATDKQALLPGGTASFANFTGYTQGINGIMIDVADLPAYVTASDFTFLAGNSTNVSQWSAAPAPASVLVRPGAGTGGSTRVEITWANGTLRNTWLQVTMLADANTGLASPDVFYFGNLIGDGGEAASGGQFTVTTADVTDAQNDLHSFLDPASVTDPNDYNRDGRVDATDEMIAGFSLNDSLVALQAPAVPAAHAAATAVVETPSGLAPTGDEVYMIELINQARANPTATAAEFGINLNEGLAAGTISSSPAPPLAFNGDLTQAAVSHSQWMMTNQNFNHNEGTVTPQTRMQNAGYVFTSPSGSGENLAARGTSDVLVPETMIAQEFEDLFVDSSTSGRTHRINLLNPSYTDIGVGLATGTFDGSNAMLATQDFAWSASSGPYLTGVAFNDARIHDGFYEPGEGLGGITVTAVNVATQASYSTVTWPAGAYTLSLPAGTYTVTASGTGLGGTITRSNVVIGSQNVEEDFTPTGNSYIAGRYVFYNDSVFDGNNSAANAADDGAIATDKQALLPGVPATFANYTSYVQGINGIMVDIANLPAGTTLQASDFSFQIGNSATGSTWSAAPAPSAFLVRPGAGVNGSTRVEFTWANGAMRNTWLQVTVAADADTGLLTPDIFYFGNAIGSSGDNPSSAAVTLSDPVVTQSNLRGFLNPAPITDPYDYNRDGRVDATDIMISQNDYGFTLNLFTPTDPDDSTESGSTSLVPAVKTTAKPAAATTKTATTVKATPASEKSTKKK